MSRDRLKLSHSRDSLCRTNATALSHPHDTGSSNNISYSVISSHDPDTAAQVTGEVEVRTAASRARPRSGARFLKGPIPWDTVAAAARLSGKALALYLAIRHRCDLERLSTVTLPAALLRELGIDRGAKARGLHVLEAAGLIRVERKGRRAARITLGRPSPGEPAPQA